MSADARPGSFLNRISRISDIGLAFGLVGIVVMMVIPLPPVILDILLTFNITATLIILLVGMYINQPLQFSIFPSLLLVVTLFRLALNISGTRLILLNGYAGEVINSFGNFVLGGNYIVGVVVFLILVVIQFVVVTNGAQRIAEVAARFTLDAMPGKQMSIDADFNAGLINEDQAREKRREIERESDFYGAMDGASKFIRGDAIAAIIIILVNIIGGLLIGVWQNGMPIMEALQRYTLLTVGEGLVTQIPALLVSTAAGIVVSRSASDVNMGEDMTRQLLSRPRALMVAAGLLLFMVAVPGLPKLPFLVMGISVAFIAHTLQQAIKHDEKTKKEEEEKIQTPEDFNNLMEIDPLELSIGSGLIPLVDPRKGGPLLEKITQIRKQCALELGIIVPPVRIRDDLTVEHNVYVVKLYGSILCREKIMINQYLAINPGGINEEIEGQLTIEPTFKLPALWIKEEDRERAESAGYTVVDPVTLIATHLFEIIRNYAHELLSRQEVQSLVSRVRMNNPVLVEELIPNLMGIGEIQKIIQNLLKERVSVRNLVIILETLASQCKNTKDLDILTELVRQSLSRSICQDYKTPDSKIIVLTLDPRLEREILEALQRSQKDIYTSMDPGMIRSIYRNLLAKVEQIAKLGITPVVLTSAAVRKHFKQLTMRVIPNLVVLSYSEILPEIKVESLGMVSLEAPPVSHVDDAPKNQMSPDAPAGGGVVDNRNSNPENDKSASLSFSRGGG